VSGHHSGTLPVQGLASAASALKSPESQHRDWGGAEVKEIEATKETMLEVGKVASVRSLALSCGGTHVRKAVDAKGATPE
jgi:hypothetical protein